MYKFAFEIKSLRSYKPTNQPVALNLSLSIAGSSPAPTSAATTIPTALHAKATGLQCSQTFYSIVHNIAGGFLLSEMDKASDNLLKQSQAAYHA